MRFAFASALLCLAWCLTAPLALTRPARANVLWDQLSASGYGFASQDFEEAYECYDCLAADDFEVPEPGWIIETVEWDMMLYYGAEAPVHGIHIYIMPDRGDNLGDYDNPVYHEFAPVHTVYDGTNIVALTTPAALEPGHYFFGAAPALDFEAYSQCFLETTSYAPVGQEMHMINPNGCFGMGSDWFQPSPDYDASFRLYGEILEAGYPDAVIDLPTDDVVIYEGDYVEFAGTATDEDGEIVDWLWTFGEGSGIDDIHVEDPGPVQFDIAGVFTVTFNAQDNDGNWDWSPDKRTVTVDPGYPDAVIDLPVGDVVIYPGDYVEFAGTATDENGEIVDWLWTFGEGSGIDDVHVEDPGPVQFNNVGVFTVTFDAQDNEGNWDPTPDERTITVDPGYPDAVIDLPTDDVTILRHQSVGFAGTATDDNGEIVGWLWTFGEGSGIDDMHVEDPGQVQFDNAGEFTVTFNAEDNDGNWDQTPGERTITVSEGFPDAVIHLPDGDVSISRGDYVDFAGTATDENGEIVDWLWTFGEGSGIDDMHVEDPGLVQFNNLGVFTVMFNAQDDDGNWDPEPDTRTITVRGIAYVDQNASGPGHDGASWDTAFLTVQKGVHAAAGSGSAVWVADGTYVENVVIGDGVPAYGGFLGAEEGGYETELDQRDWSGNVAVIDGNQSGSCVAVASDSRLDGFTVTNGSGTPGEYGWLYGGGVYCKDAGGCVVIANCHVSANLGADDFIGGGICCYGSSPTIVNCVINGNAAAYGAGILLLGSSALVTNNTICDNAAEFQGGGLYCGYQCGPTVANNIVMANSATDNGGGIWSQAGGAFPELWHNDFWNNVPNDYHGCDPGQGDISEDPRLVDPEWGDFHLNHGSPCIDAGTNDAPGLPESDFEGDPRIMDGDGDEVFVVDIGADEHPPDECVFTEAPDPEPYCDGALFGGPAAGYPGWVWFSVPLDPADCCQGAECYDPSVLLGFSCGGRLWYWDKYGKWAQVYKPPYLEWELSAGDSYLLYLDSAVENSAYEGVYPEMPFEFRLGRQGWTWVGMPGLAELGYPDFMSEVEVEYPVGGVIRTAGEDYNETPNNWVSWGWAFWDTYAQAPQTFTPYAEFGMNTCYPWLGYRVWVNVGTAQTEGDPDQVTLIWP